VESVRVDRWLCAARVFKSRTLATQACIGGHVTLNEGRAKPDSKLKPGDLLEVQTETVLRILCVRALAERRLSPPLARELYEDRTPPPAPRDARDRSPAERERGSGRPTKRERRDTDRLRYR
jgi:ribosome-associated heat shock protein Hsp15